MKELRGAGSPFPVAVNVDPPSDMEPATPAFYSAVPMGIDAGDRRVVFGMNIAATAALLRTLADDIEARRVVLLQGAVTSKVTRDDYASTWVTVKISEAIRRRAAETEPIP
jgi:hypothetical protein